MAVLLFILRLIGWILLALLELVRGGRVTLGPEGELKMRRGRIDRTKEEQ